MRASNRKVGAMADAAPSGKLAQLAQAHRRVRGKLWLLAWAIVIQIALLALTLLIVVVAPNFRSAPAFLPAKTIYLPQRQLEHQAAVAEFQQAASAPVLPPRLTTESLLLDSLPALPALPSESFTPFESETPAPNAEGLLGDSGLMEALSGLSAGSSEVNFFGIREQATRIVILVDTSDSMFQRSRQGQLHRFDFKDIKREVSNLIGELNANTLFNVAVYEGGSMAWSDQLVPATVENKAAATEWMDGLSESPSATITSRANVGPKLLEGGGTRLDTGFRQVFGFRPEVIFVVTDGEINRGHFKTIPEREMLKLVADLQTTLEQPARIHVIQYETAMARPEEIDTMKAIASKNKGRYRKILANEL